MIGFHGRYSYLVPHGDESSNWIAKTSFFLNPYFRFLTLELTSALPLTTRPPLAPRSPCTSPSPKVGKSFTADGMRYMTICNLFQGQRRKFIAFVSICKRTTCRAPTSPKLVPGSRFTSRTSVSEIQPGASAAICAHHRVGHLGFLSCFRPCSSCWQVDRVIWPRLKVSVPHLCLGEFLY